jgi:lipoprotein-anchoring transpeptidase ErfK/SrfK
MLLFITAGGVMFARSVFGLQPLLQPLTALVTKPAPIVLSPRAKDTRLVVDLSDRHVTIYRNGKQLKKFDVAIGQKGWETPIGDFTIHQMKINPEWQHPITREVFPRGPENPLGDRWIGFYEGEHMAIGFHGTPNESLVGSAVSHGCLRMRNQDIRAMYEEIGIGTVVEVQS